MMKNKIFIKSLSLIGAIGVISPITYLFTSCNKGNPNIDIKQNDNIEISTEASEVKVGEDFVINFKLKENFSLDFTNSKITFPESNFDITLADCQIDSVNYKITIPAEKVTYSKIVLDIKAETCVVNTITADEYNSIRNFFTEQEERTYQIIGSIIPQVNPEEKTVHYSYLANGRDDALLKTSYKKVQGEIKTVEEKYFGKAEKDSVEDIYPGYLSIYSTDEGATYTGIPCVSTYQRKQILEFTSIYFPTFDKVTPNTVLNLFVMQPTGSDGYKYIKFNGSKQVTAFAGQVYTSSLSDYRFDVTYENQVIPFEQYTKKDGCFCDYSDWQQTNTINITTTKAVQCKHALIKAKPSGLWSASNPIYISFANGTSMPTAPKDISVYLNGEKLVAGVNPGQYRSDGSKLKIVGGSPYLKLTNNTIVICIGNSPTFDEESSTSLVNIYQEPDPELE